MIKLRVRTTNPDTFASESFWAEPISDTTARVNNLLVNGVISGGDVVEYDASGLVVRVISRNPDPTWLISVEGQPERENPEHETAMRQLTSVIAATAGEHGLNPEVLVPGAVAVVGSAQQVEQALDAVDADPDVATWLEMIPPDTDEDSDYRIRYSMMCSPDQPTGTWGLNLEPEPVVDVEPRPDFDWTATEHPEAVEWAQRHQMPDLSAEDILTAAEVVAREHRGAQDRILAGDHITPVFIATNWYLREAGLPTLTRLDDEFPTGA